MAWVSGLSPGKLPTARLKTLLFGVLKCGGQSWVKQHQPLVRACCLTRPSGTSYVGAWQLPVPSCKPMDSHLRGGQKRPSSLQRTPPVVHIALMGLWRPLKDDAPPRPHSGCILKELVLAHPKGGNHHEVAFQLQNVVCHLSAEIS